MSTNADKKFVMKTLNLGVNAMIEKPFAACELQTLIDRVIPPFSEVPIRLIPEAYSVEVGETHIALTPIEFHIVTELWRNRGRLVRRNDLCTVLWGATRVSDHTFDTHFSNMKRKIPGLRNRIKVVRGLGYIFAS